MITGPEKSTDLAILGTGMAGMAAARSACSRNLDTVVVGRSSALNFASGFIDLMGVHPVETGRIWNRPWSALEALRASRAHHPLARMPEAEIRRAMDHLFAFLSAAGLPYTCRENENVRALTPIGTVKTTYALPESMAAVVTALEQTPPCLIVDFKGLKGFSGRQIVEAHRSRWPDLKTVRLRFPDSSGELYPERMAMALSNPAVRRELARIVSPHAAGVHMVGMPAVLGLHHSHAVFTDMQHRLGRSLFEIPTMPPAIPGLRLKHIFQTGLEKKAVPFFGQHQVTRAEMAPDTTFRLHIASAHESFTLLAKAVVLATGRFLGGGLRGDRARIHETVFSLPVHQPDSREQWHRRQFFDPRGHAVNRAGLETDTRFRPLDATGRPHYKNLFAAGSILAHQDWIRQKCGSALAVATAWGAVRAAEKLLKKNR